jgi:hypothetical protein
MKAALGDAWVQTLGFVALCSAALCLLAQHAPASRSSASKRASRKIVDARLARDADTNDLAAAAAASGPGDTLYVRAGSYKGPVKLAEGTRLLGLGPAEAIVIEGDGKTPLIEAAGGAVTISSVSLRGGAPAVYVHKGAGSAAELDRVKVLRSARDGVFVRDGAEATIARSELIGQKACGLLVASASARLRESTVSLNDIGVCSDAASKVDTAGTDLNGNLRGPTARQ